MKANELNNLCSILQIRIDRVKNDDVKEICEIKMVYG